MLDLGFASLGSLLHAQSRKTRSKQLGLHEHHRIDVMLKTDQWYQSLGRFSIVFDAKLCFQS